MGAMSFTHWIVVVLIVVLLFGRNIVSSFMADLGKSIRALRDIHREGF